MGAGFKVRVDGLLRGVTDAQGRFSLRVPLEAQHISLESAPNHFGDEQLPPRTAGANQAVTVLVDGSKEIGQDSRLRLDALQQGLLPPTAASIVLRFLKDEQFVRLAHVDWVHLIAAGGSLTRLDRLFSLQADGSLMAQGPAFRQAIAGKGNRLRLELSASDTLGQVHTDALDFVLAQHRVRLQLQAPPSNPGLSVAGLRVQVEVLGTDVQLLTQADAQGSVMLPEMPSGKLSLRALAQAGGLTYVSYGTVALGQDSLVSLVLLGPQDVLSNVLPIHIEPLPGGSRAPQGRGPRPSH